MTQRVILDVDTGGDDAVALLLAGHHPALELAAVTTTFGNAPLPVTLDNTLAALAAGQLGHVPVYAGAERPMVGEALKTLPTQAARLPLPEHSLEPQPGRAAQFLVEYYLGPHGPDTIYLPVGPHTNLALALRLEPRIAARIPRIVTMGGAYLEGNTTPSAEFNILADPEAAHIVFTSGIPITMIGLEVTARGWLSLADTQRIRALGTPWAHAAADLAERDVRWFMANRATGEGQIFDACAVAAVIDPSLVATRPMPVWLELRGEYTRGRTVADISHQDRVAKLWRPGAPVDVGTDINRERFVEVLLDGLR